MKRSLKQILFWIVLIVVFMIIVLWVGAYASTQVVREIDLSNVTTVLN